MDVFYEARKRRLAERWQDALDAEEIRFRRLLAKAEKLVSKAEGLTHPCPVCGVPVPPGRVYCSPAHRKKTRSKKQNVRRQTFLNRPVVAWDTEGWRKRVRLLGNSDGLQLLKREGYTTRELLDIIYNYQTQFKRTIHVSFSFGYDANLILADIGLPAVYKLANTKKLRIRDKRTGMLWRLKYIPKKYLSIRKGTGHTLTIWDVWGFFQGSFVAACKEWGVTLPAEVEEGKEARANIEEWTDEQIISYNTAECVALKELTEKLLKLIRDLGLPMKRADGSGALAGAWLRKYLPREGLQEVPSFAEDRKFELAVRTAYHGGRIDISRCGLIRPSFHYDLVQAYSSAIPMLIDLSKITWVLLDREKGDEIYIEPWGLYEFDWNIQGGVLGHERKSRHGWNPLPWRSKAGNIIYPSAGRGWYWGVELEGFPGLTRQHLYRCYYPTGEFYYPIRAAYVETSEARLAYKAQGDPRAKVLKNALNSLYGKFAQQVGERGPGRWFQPIYSGWITALTRRRINEVIQAVGERNVIAVQTDSVFLDVPLPDRFIGTEPGKWEQQKDNGLTLIEPGVYRMEYSDKHTAERARGFGRGNIDFEGILRDWVQGTGTAHIIKSIRFIGAKLAAANPHTLGPHWCEFIELQRKISPPWLVGTSKRSPADDLQFHFPYTLLREMEIADLPKNEQARISQPYAKDIGYVEEDEYSEEGLRHATQSSEGQFPC